MFRATDNCSCARGDNHRFTIHVTRAIVQIEVIVRPIREGQVKGVRRAFLEHDLPCPTLSLQWCRAETVRYATSYRIREGCRIDSRIDISRLLCKLAPRQRAVLHLTTFEGLSDREIGEALGIASSSVRAHRLRARRRLAALAGGGTNDE